MESAGTWTHVAWICTASETLWRIYKCNPYAYTAIDNGYLSHSYWAYSIAYFLCVAVIFMDIKKYDFFKSPSLRSLLSFLHAADGIVALILALAFYYKSPLLLYGGVCAITKVFLLHLLSRMVTGEAAFGPWAITLQTTKTFLHHTGSVLFICDNNTALITGLWRFISMNGHAAMTLRERLDEDIYDRLMWIITHMRNLVLVLVLALCVMYPTVRRGFALSATGHVAYMIVRLGPVFRIGSMYMKGEKEKKRWSKELTDGERLQLLLAGKYPWFALELGLLAMACVYFTVLRLTTYGTLAPGTCYIV